MLKELAHDLPGESAWLDAQTLLADITGKNRAWVLSHPEATLPLGQQDKLIAAVEKLRNGVPLPYVLGHWEFFGLDFLVNSAVLIPRPETELLVETAIAHARHRPQNRINILDIGTGSGAIAVSLGVMIPDATLIATDISFQALKIAQANADRHGIGNRITFIQADLLPDQILTQHFDLICANLPYIPSETLHSLEIYGKEPTLALDGGPDGLTVIRKLLYKLAEHKPSDVLILLEIEERQGKTATELARICFPAATIQVKRDLAGFDRLLIIII